MCCICKSINIHDSARVRCRLVVITLTTRAGPVDPTDANVLYLSGFDALTPEVIRSFAVGDLDSVSAG